MRMREEQRRTLDLILDPSKVSVPKFKANPMSVPKSANPWKKNRRERKRGDSRYRKMSTPSAEDLGKVQIVLDFLKGTFPGRFRQFHAPPISANASFEGAEGVLT
jgi:hypothetical protein